MSEKADKGRVGLFPIGYFPNRTSLRSIMSVGDKGTLIKEQVTLGLTGEAMKYCTGYIGMLHGRMSSRAAKYRQG